jgi:hypothetical protein
MLEMSEARQHHKFVAPNLGVGKKGRVLGFGHSGTHNGHASAVTNHWPIINKIRIVGTQVVETSGSATGLRTVEVGSTGVDAQEHVGRLEDKAAVGV